jgi:hypothetical protein
VKADLTSELCKLVMDSRLRGNDKKQISALICGYLRLMNLKKQSQFIDEQLGVTFFIEGVYDKTHPAGHKKTNPNKANLFVLSAVYCVLRSALWS